MKKEIQLLLLSILLLFPLAKSKAQIALLQDYKNNTSAPIGTFQGINFREAGFSALYPIAGTNGKEFWTCSDRGVNVDAANANPAACRPTYDKIYGFPGYAPKIHRIRLNGDSIQILQTITMKRPNGSNASGIINPTNLGSSGAEVASTDTVLNCANFNLKTTAKDTFGIDSEGLVVDPDGNFWICEEGGPTIWKLNKNGVVIKRYTPYANLPGVQSVDVQIDTVFKYRKNNRGFEGIAITPNGKIYAIIQSPVLYPNKSVGEGTRVHRILEINPADNSTRMFAYLNDGIIGSGSNQIRLRDWKIGDMAAINNDEFLVLEAALRGTTDIKRMYKINISAATPVHSGLYSGVTLEALVDAAGLGINGIVPVTKMLVMDLLASGWPAALDKAEGLAIINDSTIAIGNDNDYGQVSPAENGVATATTNLSHVFTYRLSGSSKLNNFIPVVTLLSQGETGPSTSQTPYLLPSVPDAKFTSILTATEAVGGYKMCGTPDGLGAFDNGNGTFTVLMNHEFGNAAGAVRAHGSKGAFVSRWVINKNDLSVVSGADLIQTVKIWNGTGYDTYNSSNPSALSAFGRFCSADLPAVSAFYNSATGLGTQERIFMNGEETGNDGRAFGHIATGTEAGTTYQLPYLGKFSWENSVARPFASDKTVVAGLDDSTPGQVYFYIGTKTNTGTDVDKAGLNGGKLYGVAVSGLLSETSAGVPAPGTAFSLADLGQVQNVNGTTLNTNSNNAGVTTFLRPEDGAWDPSNLNDFYFVTTNGFNSPSRLWKVHFTDIANPEMGGTITAVLNGTEGQQMFDNMTIDNYGHVLLTEDVGGNAHIGKVWQYTIATDVLVQVGQHDPGRFLNGAPNFLTQDEEASGIIDVQHILGQGKFLVDVQAHYGIAGEVVEGGQLLAYFNPDTYNAPPHVFSVNGGGSYCPGNPGVPVGLSGSETGVSYQLILNGSTNVGSPVNGTGSAISFGNQTAAGMYTVSAKNIASGVTSGMSGSATVIVNPAVTADAGPNKTVYIGYAPMSCTGLTAAATGGTPGYSFLWSTGSTAGSITVCPSVTTKYTVVVTDSKGCKAKDSVLVCAKNVKCERSKVQLCATLAINGHILGRETFCLPQAAATALLDLSNPVLVWTLGSCGSGNSCNYETLAKGSKPEEGDFGKITLSPEERALVYGDMFIKLYPNPSSKTSFVNLEIRNAEDKTVQVTVKDILGKEVYNEQVPVNETVINYKLDLGIDLMQGTYVVTVRTGNTVLTEKLIIQ